MSKLLRCVVLAAGITGIVGFGGVGDSLAQPKKEKTVKGGGTVEINEGKDSKFRFVIRDAAGKMLAMSGPTGFETKEDAAKALETLKSVLPDAKVVTGKKAKEKSK